MEIFRSFWYKGPLSAYEKMCIASFINHGHQFFLYSYDSIEVPNGATLLDANEIVAEEDYFCYSDGPGKGSPSAFSNLFRYELLLRYGGWWVDTDVVCLTREPPKQDVVYAYQDTKLINGAIFKITPVHSLIYQLASEAKLLGKDISWGQAGPELITRLVKQNSMEKHCVPTSALYPLDYDEALLPLRPSATPDVRSRCEGAQFLHLWNEILKRSAIRKDIAPPTGSFLEKLFQENGVSFESGLRYTEREIDFMSENSFINRYKMQLERDAARQAYRELQSNLSADKLTESDLNGSLILVSKKLDDLEKAISRVLESQSENNPRKVDRFSKLLNKFRNIKHFFN
jgi:hypothetical protein